MEKLQRALSKARQERSENTAAPPPASARATETDAQAATPAPAHASAPAPAKKSLAGASQTSVRLLWDELPPYEPNPDNLLANRITTLNAQAAPDPFDILRTKVFLLMRQNGWSRMAITSPTKACGKTTTACNLAVGFSRQRENRTMLFDVDLRRPGVANLLGRKPEYGIKSMLTGEVSPRDHLLCLRGNVSLSMARSSASDPTQLLLSEKTKEMFDHLQTTFVPDIMIFDLPPMLVTDDARAFLKNVDCALIVARAEQTKMSQLDICEREVAEHTNVLGVVLNNCRHVAEEEQYYGEYQ